MYFIIFFFFFFKVEKLAKYLDPNDLGRINFKDFCHGVFAIKGMCMFHKNYLLQCHQCFCGCRKCNDQRQNVCWEAAVCFSGWYRHKQLQFPAVLLGFHFYVSYKLKKNKKSRARLLFFIFVFLRIVGGDLFSKGCMFLAMCCSCCSWFVLGWCSNVIIPDLRLAGVYATESNMAGLAASSFDCDYL